MFIDIRWSREREETVDGANYDSALPITALEQIQN